MTLKEELIDLRLEMLKENKEKEIAKDAIESKINFYYKKQIKEDPSADFCKVAVLSEEPHKIAMYSHKANKFVDLKEGIRLTQEEYISSKKYARELYEIDVYPLEQYEISELKGEQYIFELKLPYDEEEEVGG